MGCWGLSFGASNYVSRNRCYLSSDDLDRLRPEVACQLGCATARTQFAQIDAPGLTGSHYQFTTPLSTHRPTLSSDLPRLRQDRASHDNTSKVSFPQSGRITTRAGQKFVEPLIPTPQPLRSYDGRLPRNIVTGGQCANQHESRQAQLFAKQRDCGRRPRCIDVPLPRTRSHRRELDHTRRH